MTKDNIFDAERLNPISDSYSTPQKYMFLKKLLFKTKLGKV